MQQNNMAGKERSFGIGLLLTIVTLGIYAIYWHYKAHDEVLKQYPVEEFPTVLYILCFVPVVNFVALIMYMSRFIGNVNAVRAQLGMQRGIELGPFLLWSILGALIIVGPFVAYTKLQDAVNGVWRHTGAGAPLAVSGTAPA